MPSPASESVTAPDLGTVARPMDRGPFEIGTIVGENYLIDGELGRGGMGVVYDALDRKLPRRVAIKAPLSARFAQALHREAEALASIRHPGFVSIHHLGVQGEVEFMVMERLFGDTLARRIDDLRLDGQRFAIADVLELLIAISGALAAAHAAGVAHRDVKPSNIVLSGERVVLVDLGLVVPEVLAVQDDHPAGSAHYMAPEVILCLVARGGGHLVDLYALGTVAYELLTGAPPFLGDQISEVVAGHLAGDIPDPADVREDVPRALAMLVRELLAKEPLERPESAEAVHWQLEEIRASAVVRGLESRRPSTRH